MYRLAPEQRQAGAPGALGLALAASPLAVVPGSCQAQLGPAPWTLAPDKAWGWAGLAATLPGSGCGGDAVLSPTPAALKGGKLAVWPGLVAARVQHYNAWLRDEQGPSRARGPAGTQLPPRASWPPLPSWGQAGAKLRRGDGAGSSTVSIGDGALVALPTRGWGRGRAWGRGGSVPRPMAQWQAGSPGLAALCAGVRR